jgi:hypothetical protein
MRDSHFYETFLLSQSRKAFLAFESGSEKEKSPNDIVIKNDLFEVGLNKPWLRPS